MTVQTKRADQLVNGDILVLETEGRQHLALVNGVMQFKDKPGRTCIGLINPETMAVMNSELSVPNYLRFKILELTKN